MKSFERLEEDLNISALGNDGTSHLSEYLNWLELKKEKNVLGLIGKGVQEERKYERRRWR